MTVRLTRRAVLSGLGVLAGAVLPLTASAQRPRPARPAPRDTVARPDTVRVPLPPRADSMIRNDSIAQGILGRGEQRTVDTLHAPLPRPESPLALEIGGARVYDRAAIYATGALTLSDLLGRLPGLTRFATGWLVAPTAVASQGDFRRIRVFLDGLELDPMQQREQGRAPVNELALHSLEELRIERGADEVRVYGRTWRVVSTTPATRADVITGDQNTNLYRGYFGRRYSHGEALQIAAEQGSTQPNSRIPSADERAVFVRTGALYRSWSADLTAQRVEQSRDQWVGQGNRIQQTDTIAPLSAKRTTAYLRLANGDPDAGRWLQLVASSHAYWENRTGDPGDTLTKLDSTAYGNQYLIAGGGRRGPLRLSAAERVRAAAGGLSAVPSGRASFETGPLAVSLFAEGASRLNPSRLEGTVRAEAFRLTLLGSVARAGGGVFDRVVLNDPPPTVLLLNGTFADRLPGPVVDTTRVLRYEVAPSTSARAEAGIRVADLWVSAGLLRRGPATLLPAAGLGAPFGEAAAVRHEQGATARTAALRGRLWRAINVDAWAVAWGDTAGLYRPRYQTRAELWLQTNLLDRFPRGNFGLLASLAHEYRSNARFPVTGDSVRTVLGARTLDLKLEIRIQSAVISYQFRNLAQENYAQVPGLFMPRQTQLYGVRWDFFN